MSSLSDLQGDIILLGLREFQDQKADIILKYDGGAHACLAQRAAFEPKLPAAPCR